MNLFKSWDFARLKKPKFWCKLFSGEMVGIIMAVITYVVICYMVRPLYYPEEYWMEPVSIVSAVLIVCIFGVYKICKDNNFILTDLKTKKGCRTFFEKAGPRWRRYTNIRLKHPDGDLLIGATQYDCSLFTKNARCFIFQSIEDNNWYIVNNESDTPQLLGKRITRSAFFNQYGKNLRILHGTSFAKISADSFYTGQDVALLNKHGQRIQHKEQTVLDIRHDIREVRDVAALYGKCDDKYVWKDAYMFASDFIAIKTSAGYKLLGLYLPEKQNPFYLYLNVSAMLVNDFTEVVALVNKRDYYHEICRTVGLIGKNTGNFLELKDKGNSGRIHGTICHLNLTIDKIQKVNEGRVCYITSHDNQYEIGFASGEVVCI